VLLLAAVGLVLLLCPSLDHAGRYLVLTGLLGIGVIVALVGWVAVAWHLTPWAIPSAGLWRGASTLTYANAAAAVLVPLALTAASVLSTRPRSVTLALTLMILLVGAAVTLSRAGMFALVIGFAVLLALRGRSVLVALVAPAAGAGVAFLALSPSMRTFPPARPGLAAAGLAAGLGLVVLLLVYVKGRTIWVLGLATSALLVVGAVAFSRPEAHLWHHRANLSSPSRSNAASRALAVFEAHPVAGVGLGDVLITRTDSSGRLHMQQYAHDEYLQTLMEQGVIGAALLVALLIAVGRLLWRSRPSDAVRRALWAGVAAAGAAGAVHAGFDFVWHVPAIPLILATLIGLVIPPASDGSSDVERKEIA
jgi:O-antigen ligase